MAGDVRDKASCITNAEIDRRLPEIDRQELSMEVGDMDERDVAERIKAQQLALR